MKKLLCLLLLVSAPLAAQQSHSFVMHVTYAPTCNPEAAKQCQDMCADLSRYCSAAGNDTEGFKLSLEKAVETMKSIITCTRDNAEVAVQYTIDQEMTCSQGTVIALTMIVDDICENKEQIHALFDQLSTNQDTMFEYVHNLVTALELCAGSGQTTLYVDPTVEATIENADNDDAIIE